jgi:hypothetical protein
MGIVILLIISLAVIGMAVIVVRAPAWMQITSAEISIARILQRSKMLRASMLCARARLLPFVMGMK